MVTPWRKIASKRGAGSRYRWLDDVVFELPEGRHETFAIASTVTSVCVLALTLSGDVVLARQFRPGPELVLDELPGGGVEAGETFPEAARRELLEETGYAASELIPLGQLHDCGYARVERHAFLAKGCVRVRDQELDASEFIEVVTKPLPEFLEQLRSGMCTDLEVGWAGLFAAGVLSFDPAGLRAPV